MIDDNPMEIRVMKLFRAGRKAQARRLQEKFLASVLKPGVDYCSCPADCSLHGKCVKCVVLHRGHGDHLPHCFQKMVNRRIESLSELTEHSIKRKGKAAK